MRPIVMTTLAAILTLLPLGLAIGQGAAMQQPLAIAIMPHTAHAASNGMIRIEIATKNRS